MEELGQSYASDSARQDAPTAPPKNFVARIVGTWFSPGETFAEMKHAPKLLLPIIFSIVFGALTGYLMSQRLDMTRMMREQFDQAVADGKMKAEDADTQAQAIGKFGTIQFVVGGAIGSLLGALFIAGIFKLVSMVMGHDNTFSALFAVTLYTFIAVTLISSLVFLGLLYLKDPSEITFNNMGNIVASNVDSWIALVAGENALPKFLKAFLQRVDLFSIWMITLLSIGYAAVTTRMKTTTAATYLVALYLIYTLGVSAVAAIRG